MSWTKATTGVYTKSADTDRDAYTSSTPFPANGVMRLQHIKYSDEVRAFAYGSWDSRSCFEIGVSGANIKIDKVEFVSTRTNKATAAHGLTADTPFTLDVRVENRTISAYLNGSATAIVSYTVPDDDSLVAYRAFGFVSSVASATLLSFKVGELIPSIVTRARGLWWVAGGILYVTFDGDTYREVARGVARETGPVRMVEYKSKIYIVDGQKFKEVNPVSYAVTEYTATAGTVPGSGGAAGVTDLYLLVNNWARLVGVSQADPQNVYATALNDQYDWDTGAETQAHAFTFVTAKAALSGQIIRGLLSSNSNVLTIGCVSSMWQLLGDPARGQVLLEKRSSTIGVSGPDAMIQADENIILLHGPQGLHVMAGTNAPTSISQATLSKYIQFPESDRELYTVSLVRDTGRNGCLLCLTKVGQASLHFWYDERVGNFTNGSGGFFPFSFPTGKSPTAAIYYDGRLILGCEDGYIRVADDDATSDDGTNIESYAALERVDPPNARGDTILKWLQVIPAASSATVTARVWKGQTPEQAYSQTARALGYTRTFSLGSGVATMPVRGGSVVVELYAASGRWMVEEVQVRQEQAAVLTRIPYSGVTAPGRVCQSVGAGSGSGGSGSGSGFNSGPGSGGSGFGSGSGIGSGSGSGSGLGLGGSAAGSGPAAGGSVVEV